MNDKRMRGNKELKKPKQPPRVVTPPIDGPAPTATAQGRKPQQAKK